jgi:hypothetical protein
MKRRFSVPIGFLLLSFIAASCSSLPTVAKKDALGTTLFSLKTAYESFMAEAGYAYTRGDLAEQDLTAIVAAGNHFFTTYRVALDPYLLGKTSDGSKEIEQVKAALDQIEHLIITYARKGKDHEPSPAPSSSDLIADGGAALSRSVG